jgi:hypothetical protein
VDDTPRRPAPRAAPSGAVDDVDAAVAALDEQLAADTHEYDAPADFPEDDPPPPAPPTLPEPEPRRADPDTKLALLDRSTGELAPAVTADALLRAAGIADVRDADDEALTVFLDRLKTLGSIATEARTIAGAELTSRMDRRGAWTLRAAGGLKAAAASPTAGTEVWDDKALKAAVDDLVDEGLIEREAADAAIKYETPEPVLKRKASGVLALVRLGGAVAAAVEACRTQGDPKAPEQRLPNVTRPATPRGEQ